MSWHAIAASPRRRTQATHRCAHEPVCPLRSRTAPRCPGDSRPQRWRVGVGAFPLPAGASSGTDRKYELTQFLPHQDAPTASTLPSPAHAGEETGVRVFSASPSPISRKRSHVLSALEQGQVRVEAFPPPAVAGWGGGSPALRRPAGGAPVVRLGARSARMPPERRPSLSEG